MPGLVPGIHVFRAAGKDVDGRDIGERSDAVLRTAMPGHDEWSTLLVSAQSRRRRARFPLRFLRCRICSRLPDRQPDEQRIRAERRAGPRRARCRRALLRHLHQGSRRHGLAACARRQIVRGTGPLSYQTLIQVSCSRNLRRAISQVVVAVSPVPPSPKHCGDRPGSIPQPPPGCRGSFFAGPYGSASRAFEITELFRLGSFWQFARSLIRAPALSAVL